MQDHGSSEFPNTEQEIVVYFTMSEEKKDSFKVDTKPIQGGSSQGIQNMTYSDAESIIDQNPPHYNQINSSVQPSNIAPISVLPGQVHQAQLLTLQQNMAPPGQIIQPNGLPSNVILPNASTVPQVIYVQPTTQRLMPTPVQQGQQIVYIQNPDVNRVPSICDCESPGYFVWFLIGFCCPPIATFLTSRKLNEGCSAVRHILPFILLILGCAGE